jgi:hypothetical protein
MVKNALFGGFLLGLRIINAIPVVGISAQKYQWLVLRTSGLLNYFRVI